MNKWQEIPGFSRYEVSREGHVRYWLAYGYKLKLEHDQQKSRKKVP